MADLGSAILQGIQSVQDGAARRQQMRLDRDRMELDRQRTESALAVDKSQLQNLELARSETIRLRDEAIKTTRIADQKRFGDNLLSMMKPLGAVSFENRDRPISGQALIEALKNPDPVKRGAAERVLVDFYNHERDTRAISSGQYESDDFRFTTLDPEALAKGQIVVRGEYKDGRPGVATVDGSSDPNSPVLALSFDDAARHIELYAKTDLLPTGSNLGADSQWFRSQVFTDAMAPGSVNQPSSGQRQSGGQSASALSVETDRLTRTVVSAAGQISGPEGARLARAAIAEAGDNPQEIIKRLTGIAEALNKSGANIQIPRNLLSGSRRGNARDLIEPFPTRIPSGAPDPASHASFVTGTDPSAIRLSESQISRAVPTNNPVANIDNKISKLEKKADKLSGDARVSAETELNQLRESRQKLVGDLNSGAFRKIVSELDALEKERERTPNERRASFDAKIQALNARRDAYVRAGFATPQMQTQSFKEFKDSVLARLDTLTGAQAAELVRNQQITFTPQQARVVASRAREAGVQTPADISKLPSKAEQIALLGVMASWTDNPQERQTLLAYMANVGETGSLSWSSKDLAEYRLEQIKTNIAAGNLDVARANFELQRGEASQRELARRIESGENVGAHIRKINSDFNQTFRLGLVGGKPMGKNEEDTGYTANSTGQRALAALHFHTVPLLQTYKGLQGTIPAAQLQPMLAEINSQVGAVIGVMSNENRWEWFQDKSQITIGDDVLSRLQPVYGKGRNGQQTIKGFNYLSPSGSKTGGFVSSSQIRNADPALFEVVKAAVIANEAIKEAGQ
jgi:hypothetical protein